jgi:uncharacterized membrane protein
MKYLFYYSIIFAIVLIINGMTAFLRRNDRFSLIVSIVAAVSLLGSLFVFFVENVDFYLMRKRDNIMAETSMSGLHAVFYISLAIALFNLIQWLLRKQTYPALINLVMAGIQIVVYFFLLTRYSS